MYGTLLKLPRLVVGPLHGALDGDAQAKYEYDFGQQDALEREVGILGCSVLCPTTVPFSEKATKPRTTRDDTVRQEIDRTHDQNLGEGQ